MWYLGEQPESNVRPKLEHRLKTKGPAKSWVESIAQMNEREQAAMERLGGDHDNFVPRPNKINAAIDAMDTQPPVPARRTFPSIFDTPSEAVAAAQRSEASTDDRLGPAQIPAKRRAEEESQACEPAKKKPRAKRPYCTPCKSNPTLPKCDHVLPCTSCLNKGQAEACVYDPAALYKSNFDPPKREDVSGADLTKGVFLAKSIVWDTATGLPSGKKRNPTPGGRRIKGIRVKDIAAQLASQQAKDADLEEGEVQD